MVKTSKDLKVKKTRHLSSIAPFEQNQHDLLIKPVRKDATTKYFRPLHSLRQAKHELGAAFLIFLFILTRKEKLKRKFKIHETRQSNLPNKITAEREQELEDVCQVGDVLLRSFIALENKNVNQKIAINYDQFTSLVSKGKAFNSINGSNDDGIPCELVRYIYLCWSPYGVGIFCLFFVKPKRLRIRR